MDHVQFVRSLSAEDRRAFTQTSDARGLVHLLGHLAIILALGVAISSGIAFWWALLLPYGIALVFLFTLEHEATHRTPFRNAGLNDWIGRLCGIVLILPFEWFRYFHLAHHKHTNDPEMDPELAGAPMVGRWNFIKQVSGVPYWASMIWQLFRNALGRSFGPWIPDRAKSRIKWEARAMILLYGVAGASMFYADTLLWIWILPIAIGQPFLRLYLMAEHGRCPNVANMFENTRTTYTGRLIRFIAWNMPYHAEHHAYPSVPFWQLPRLHRRAKTHLKVTSDGYFAHTQETLRQL